MPFWYFSFYNRVLLYCAADISKGWWKTSWVFAWPCLSKPVISTWIRSGCVSCKLCGYFKQIYRTETSLLIGRPPQTPRWLSVIDLQQTKTYNSGFCFCSNQFRHFHTGPHKHCERRWRCDGRVLTLDVSVYLQGILHVYLPATFFTALLSVLGSFPRKRNDNKYAISASKDNEKVFLVSVPFSSVVGFRVFRVIVLLPSASPF